MTRTANLVHWGSFRANVDGLAPRTQHGNLIIVGQPGEAELGRLGRGGQCYQLYQLGADNSCYQTDHLEG